MIALIRRLVSSVFVRLMGVMGITALLINGLALGAFSYAFHQADRSTLHRNVAQYIIYLIDDIGTPPDPRKATRIAARTRLAISFEGPGIRFTTAPLEEHDGDDPETIRERSRVLWRGVVKGLRFGQLKGHGVVEARRGDYTYLFQFDSDFDDFEHRWLIIGLMVGGLSLLLVGSYFAMRKILRPLAGLNEGVAHVADGDLDHRIKPQGGKEFVELADAFNRMTGSVSSLLHAKERLLLDVSHELRSPLTRMKVGLEFLPDSGPKESLADDVIEMERMVTSLLEEARLAKVERPVHRSPFPFRPLLVETLAPWQGRPPGVDITAVDERATLCADREQIRTLLGNLIANSHKYSRSDSGPITVAYTRSDDGIIITVADSGEGIPEADLPFIFEPFYRVDRSRSKETGGYGLGLSLCKSIMEAHGGTIAITSVDGQGATVTLRFPMDKEGGKIAAL